MRSQSKPESKGEKESLARSIVEIEKGYEPFRGSRGPDRAHISSPEFVVSYLRTFATPGDDSHIHSQHFDLLRNLPGKEEILQDTRLDWDLWRAWLLAENAGRDSFCQAPYMLITGYLYLNAKTILKDPARRQWWVSQISRDLKFPRNGPPRRSFLIQLLKWSDSDREELEKLPPVLSERKGREDRKIHVRQTDPLNPFLVIPDKEPLPLPNFENALKRIAFAQGLSLEVRGISGASLPPTEHRWLDTSVSEDEFSIHSGPPRFEGYSVVIDQESWSGIDHGALLPRPAWNAEDWSTNPGKGVYFFVFHKRLYVWPKGKMDAALVQMMHTAGFIDDTALAEFARRGFKPLEVTLIQEKEK